MASGTNERIAHVTAAEKGSNMVIVTCLVDGLQVSGLLSKSPKNANVYLKFEEKGFDLSVIVKEKGKEVTFRKVVKKLPGPIAIKNCSWKVEKGKVIISLMKSGDDSWAVQLSQRGLEQCTDEDDE